MVKHATLPLNSFCSSVAKQVASFLPVLTRLSFVLVLANGMEIQYSLSSFFETLPRCPTTYNKSKSKNKIKGIGPVRESNPGPLAPKARIMPLDQQADDGIRRFVIVL